MLTRKLDRRFPISKYDESLSDDELIDLLLIRKGESVGAHPREARSQTEHADHSTPFGTHRPETRGAGPPFPTPRGGAVNPYELRSEFTDDGPRHLAVDLFSGAGGITLGLINAGFDVRLCSDAAECCQSTHFRNFPGIPFVRRDIHTLTGADIRQEAGVGRGELDLLIGGPPCQGFSIIGQRELCDPRNGLFHQFMRIAEELLPKILVIENVPGLATLEKGAVLAELGNAFRDAGYSIDCAELLAAQYGVPQMRWRMFFIGWRSDLGRRGGFPKPTHGRGSIGDMVPNRTIPFALTEGFVTVREAISDLPPVEAGGYAATYCRGPEGLYQDMRLNAPAKLCNHYAPRLSTQNLERLRHLRPGEDWRSLPRDLLPGSMRRALRKDHTRRFRRMRWDGIARSIITRFRDPKSGEYIHPDQHRTISIREAARIQSFPDWFVFESTNSEQYDQVGNAVPPLLAKAVGMELRTALAGPHAESRAPVRCRYRIPEPRLALEAAE
jgi:DNA (cytosine-5)-methyltransferase 1